MDISPHERKWHYKPLWCYRRQSETLEHVSAAEVNSTNPVCRITVKKAKAAWPLEKGHRQSSPTQDARAITPTASVPQLPPQGLQLPSFVKHPLGPSSYVT